MRQPSAERAYIALGSNLGDRAGHLAAARAALAGLPGTTLVAASAVEETAPLGGMPQPPYLNQMVEHDTRLSPRELLEACQAIERARGRVRAEPWGGAHARPGHRPVRPGARDRARPYHSPSRATEPRLLAARAGGAACP